MSANSFYENDSPAFPYQWKKGVDLGESELYNIGTYWAYLHKVGFVIDNDSHLAKVAARNYNKWLPES